MNPNELTPIFLRKQAASLSQISGKKHSMTSETKKLVKEMFK